MPGISCKEWHWVLGWNNYPARLNFHDRVLAQPSPEPDPVSTCAPEISGQWYISSRLVRELVGAKFHHRNSAVKQVCDR